MDGTTLIADMLFNGIHGRVSCLFALHVMSRECVCACVCWAAVQSFLSLCGFGLGLIELPSDVLAEKMHFISFPDV